MSLADRYAEPLLVYCSADECRITRPNLKADASGALWCDEHFPHSPAVAERPDEHAELRQLVANQRAHDEALVKYPLTAPIIHNVKFKTAHADALASLLRAYEGMRADAERLDWLDENSRKHAQVDDGDAQIRVEHHEGHEKYLGDEGSGFYVREWGAAVPDDEGYLDFSGRFYRRTRFDTLREAIDFARAARASAPDRAPENANG